MSTPGGTPTPGDTPKPTPGKEEPKKEAAAPEVGQMKAGDYMIHVFVEKARQMKVPEGNTVDPLIEISVMNEKKFTTAKDDIGATGVCIWNEHLFFEPKNVTVDKIESAKITIRLLDKGYFKEALIGCYEFDVAYVYFQQKHSLLHKWIALSNPESQNFNEVAGYLKISISVSTLGDEQIQITEDNSAENSEEGILMPPSIRPEFYQIHFKFFRAEKLPAMDRALVGRGSIDAYVSCNYMNSKLSTDVITVKEGDPVDWNCEFLVPCQLPIMSSRVVMKIMDKDLVKDEIVGSLLFNLKDCIDKMNGNYFWKNVYGAPLDKSGANTDLMNSNPEAASTWKGRLLMQVTAEKTEKPVCIKKPLSEEDVEKAKKFLAQREYEVIAEVGQGLALPDNSKYKVLIKIAELDLKTADPKLAKGYYNFWSHRFEQQTFKSVYKDVYDIGKLYIYLMHGSECISFYKADIEEFMNPNPDWRWIQLNPDLSVGKVKDSHKAGIISVKISIHDKTTNGPIQYKNFDAWTKDPPKRMGAKKVRAYVFQCRDLPAADSDGQSDPFIKIWDTTEQEKKTKVIEDNNNPLFYETLELTMEANKIKDMAPFIFDIYDSDALGSDFIARALIPVSDAAISETDQIPKPKWHKCKLKPDAPEEGEILVSFSVVEFDFPFKFPPKKVNLAAEAPRKEFELDINILGLRDLQSAGILPVKKAFIVFNLKSLVPPDDGRAVENVKTQPSAPGANPTINTLIKFKVPLPVDKLFQPRLLCTVHDYIFKGFNQPLLGSFTIPVGDLIDKLAEERLRETTAIAKIVKDLDDIIKGLGVSTYAIQNETFGNEEGFEAMQSRRMTQQEERKSRTQLKVDDEMKKPLLLGIEELDFEEEKKDVATMLTSPRVSARSMTVMHKKTNNPQKMVSERFDKFASGKKAELLEQQKNMEEKKKRELEDIRLRDAQDLKTTLGGASSKNVILPSYEMNERLKVELEVNNPPETLFIGLGWDETPESKTKHYRRFYPTELEKVTEVMSSPTPFDTFDLKRGQSRGASKSFWPFGGAQKQDASGEASTEQVVGRFKGTVTVQSEEDRKEYADKKAELVHGLKVKLNTLSLQKTGKPLELKLEKMDTMEGRQKFEFEMEALGVAHLNITKHLADLESDETLKRLLMSPTKCVVRVYILDAFNVSSRDNGSDSDPYLIVSCGNKSYNERDNYQTDQPNPKFHKYYDFEAVFPGCPPLNINVMDYDEIFGDDSVGITSIDLEDRYFSPEWQSVKNKPIEHRSLSHPSSSISQGTLRCWVEIHSTAIPMADVTLWNIVPKPVEDFEVRVVIYGTDGIAAQDAEGVSDIYCRAFFDSKEEAKETDTHYRCDNGKANFNYRLLFGLKHPRNDYTLSVQLYDRDFLTANDMFGEAKINLKDAIMDASYTKKPVNITKKYYNSYLKSTKALKDVKVEWKDEGSFWLPVKGLKDGKMSDVGKIRIQVDILPRDHAEKNKVGEARQEPNHSPQLPPPEGRLSLSMNPLELALKMVGPELRRKIVCFLITGLCCFLLIMLFPLIAGNIISDLIMKIF